VKRQPKSHSQPSDRPRNNLHSSSPGSSPLIIMLGVFLCATLSFSHEYAVHRRSLPQMRRAAIPVASGEELVEQLTDGVEDLIPKTLGTTEEVQDVWPLTPLRISTGVLMIHHGSEGGFWPANFGTDGFNGFVDFIVKPYFSFLPGDPALWSAVHDYIEFWGGVLLALGLLTRPVSLLLFSTMLGACYFHLASTGLQGFPFGHVENYSYNFEEPALYALIFLLFSVTGAGAFSLDQKLVRNFEDSARE
jgi:putative oxidoreductase